MDLIDRHATYAVATVLHYYAKDQLEYRGAAAWLAVTAPHLSVAAADMAREHDANYRDARADRRDILARLDENILARLDEQAGR